MRALANVDGGVVKAEIEVSAPPERVFQAITDVTELPRWWGSDEMYRTTDWQVDLRPGGKWSTVAVNADGTQSTVGGEYLEAIRHGGWSTRGGRVGMTSRRRRSDSISSRRRMELACS